MAQRDLWARTWDLFDAAFDGMHEAFDGMFASAETEATTPAGAAAPRGGETVTTTHEEETRPDGTKIVRTRTVTVRGIGTRKPAGSDRG